MYIGTEAKKQVMLPAVTRSMLLFTALLFSFKITVQSLLRGKRAGGGNAGSEGSSEHLAEWSEHKMEMPKGQTHCRTACYNRRWVGATARPLLCTVGISHALREQDDTANLLLKQVVPRALRTIPA